MGIIDAWERWSQKQWDKWGSDLQGKYDKYRAMKTPTWYLEITENIWDNLDDSGKAFLNRIVTEAKGYFNDSLAKEIVEKVISIIKKKKTG